MAYYPDIAAGDDITVDLLQAMIPQHFYKTANTDRTSTTTFADDPDLTCELEANSVYFVEMFLCYAALDAADIKTEWTVPTGATGVKSCMGPASDAVAETNANSIEGRWGVHGFGTDVTYGAPRNSASNLQYAQENGVVTTTNAGTLALAWAQNTSNGTATRMGSGSYMRVTRLA